MGFDPEAAEPEETGVLTRLPWPRRHILGVQRDFMPCLSLSAG